jgi:integrase
MAKTTLPAQHKRAAVFINNLRPTDARQEIPDEAQEGLYLLVQPKIDGRPIALSWAVRAKIGGKHATKVTIGRYDETGGSGDPAASPSVSSTQMLNVTQARALAKYVRAEAARGNDPRQQKSDKMSAAAWLDDFIKAARSTGFKRGPVKASTADEYERIVEKAIKPQWKHVADIRTLDYREVEKLLDKLVPGARRNVFAVLSAFFRWKPVMRVMGRNVIDQVEAPAIPKSRNRVLSHAEIKRVWKAAEKCGYPFGPMMQLLLCTGQRRDEIAKLKWSEISEDLDMITLDGSRTKNGKPNRVALAPLAQSILKGCPRIASEGGQPSEYVFTTTAKTAFSGFSNGKKALDKQCGEPALPEWTLHDLRRTFTSELARLGIKLEVAETILNHKSGVRGGLRAVYDLYDYEDEKREALKAWATRLQAIIADNVTPFKRPRR